MIPVLLLLLMVAQGPERLQPGTGIVTGSLKTADGKPAAGVRVGAVDAEDPSGKSFLSIAETNSAGRYRLTNVPAGDYYIVAGRLTDLHYYPSGTDRSTATKIRVEPAKIRADVNFSVAQTSQRPPSPGTPNRDELAFRQLAGEANVERKAQLMSQFEMNFPQSPRLVEAYMLLMSAYAGRNDALRTVEFGDKAIGRSPNNVRTFLEVSRTYASLQGQTSQMDKALAYANKALVLAKGLKTQNSRGTLPSAEWQAWATSMETSARNNLAWVEQVDAWQRRSLFSLVAPTRR